MRHPRRRPLARGRHTRPRFSRSRGTARSTATRFMRRPRCPFSARRGLLLSAGLVRRPRLGRPGRCRVRRLRRILQGRLPGRLLTLAAIRRPRRLTRRRAASRIMRHPRRRRPLARRRRAAKPGLSRRPGCACRSASRIMRYPRRRRPLACGRRVARPWLGRGRRASGSAGLIVRRPRGRGAGLGRRPCGGARLVVGGPRWFGRWGLLFGGGVVWRPRRLAWGGCAVALRLGWRPLP